MNSYVYLAKYTRLYAYLPDLHAFLNHAVDGKNPAPVDMVNIPPIHRVLYLPCGAGFLPSTVLHPPETPKGENHHPRDDDFMSWRQNRN